MDIKKEKHFKDLPMSDEESFKLYKKYRYLYNRYNIFKLQNIDCGEMKNIPSKFPVFIKPKINLMGGNQNCHKINNIKEFIKFKNNKTLFWAKFLNGNEGSFDIIIKKGKIVWYIHHQIYLVDDFLENYKIINSGKKLPKHFKDFVNKHLSDYTGFLNIQYRYDFMKEIIIEIGLRFDGGGRFIIALGDKNRRNN